MRKKLALRVGVLYYMAMLCDISRLSGQSEKSIMAEPKLKSAEAEAAIARLAAQMDKNVAKRPWKPATYAALVTYVVEACGGKFSTEGRAKFRTLMEDSDFSFSSNMKKYLATRGILPKEEQVEQPKFE